MLQWLGEVPMGYCSAIRVPPNNQEVRGALGQHTGLRDGAQVVIRPRTDPGLERAPFGRTTLDGIFAVSTTVWNGVVIGMLPNDQEDKENTGRRPARWRRSWAFTSPDRAGLVKAS